MTSLIIFFSFLLVYYVYFLTQIFKGLKLISKSNKSVENIEFISVIIPFRNEEKNILESLNSITSQSISKNKYEVIYIDDNSDDQSFSILDNADKAENIKILKSPVSLEERGHKKKALKYAIEKAKGEIIVTTDADCKHKPDWLKKLTNCFDQNTAFVSGPVKFETDRSLFQDLQSLEFSSLILVGAGLIGIGKPIICNAANLGFRKSVFKEVGGYEDNLNLSSGDDEFLMQKISRETKYEVSFCFDKEAIATTLPNISITEFYQQRKRWASKGFYYADKKITLKLMLIFLFYLGLPSQIILGLFINKIFIVTFIFSFIIKFLYEYQIVNFSEKELFPKTNISLFLKAEILHIPYIIVSGLTGIFGNYKWKGRNIKR
jgi:cellulose synthase/poly-beta-1,6-N-acetylglucosamine synthase-like glycosyltransferase